jgi:hypothetical protein
VCKTNPLISLYNTYLTYIYIHIRARGVLHGSLRHSLRTSVCNSESRQCGPKRWATCVRFVKPLRHRHFLSSNYPPIYSESALNHRGTSEKTDAPDTSDIPVSQLFTRSAVARHRDLSDVPVGDHVRLRDRRSERASRFHRIHADCKRHLRSNGLGLTATSGSGRSPGRALRTASARCRALCAFACWVNRPPPFVFG